MYCLEFAGEDDTFAAAEAAAAADNITVLAPGLATATDITPARIQTLAFTHRVSVCLGQTTGGLDAAVALLEDVAIDRSGSVAVRARDIRGTADIETQAAEQALGEALVDHGFTVDLETPDHELRALFSDSTIILGWLVTTSIRDYGSRQPTKRPFFQPGAMSPLLARALVNLALPHPTVEEDIIVDPMCGTGGTLIEAGLIGATPLGLDAQPKMVTGTRENLRTYLDDLPTVLRGDATALPLNADCATAVVADIPYGRQSKIARHEPTELITGTLQEANRIATRAVVVAATPLTDEVAATDWTLETRYKRRVHRSLDRHIHVLA